MGLLSEVSSSYVKPSTNEEDTIRVEGKLLVVRIVSRDLSTISLNMCGGALTPSTKVDSNTHVVETQLSLSWQVWLSLGCGIFGRSCDGGVVGSALVSLWLRCSNSH